MRPRHLLLLFQKQSSKISYCQFDLLNFVISLYWFDDSETNYSDREISWGKVFLIRDSLKFHYEFLEFLHDASQFFTFPGAEFLKESNFSVSPFLGGQGNEKVDEREFFWGEYFASVRDSLKFHYKFLADMPVITNVFS